MRGREETTTRRLNGDAQSCKDHARTHRHTPPPRRENNPLPRSSDNPLGRLPQNMFKRRHRKTSIRKRPERRYSRAVSRNVSDKLHLSAHEFSYRIHHTGLDRRQRLYLDGGCKELENYLPPPLPSISLHTADRQVRLMPKMTFSSLVSINSLTFIPQSKISRAMQLCRVLPFHSLEPQIF